MKKPEFSLSQTIMRLAELGLDETEITYSLDLTKRKFDALKKQKEIANALSAGEEIRSRKVEDALYRRAVGFEYEEIVNASTNPPSVRTNGKQSRAGRTVNSEKSAEKTSAKSTIKTVIPDVTACIFWLKNRHADKWRDNKDITNSKKHLIEAIEDYDEKSENE